MLLVVRYAGACDDVRMCLGGESYRHKANLIIGLFYYQCIIYKPTL
jgi:hypothetical protein